MLREFWEYLTTPASPEAKAFGFAAESVALGARHRRQRRAWAPHVEEARRFILDAAQYAPAGRALVAGSGRLIEVPLDALAARFDEVVLADLVHPAPVRRAAARHRNVRLAETDLSGLLAPLNAALTRGDPLPTPAPPDAFRSDGFAFAVSCNLLSQLPLLPLEAIEKRAPRVTEEERAAFARAVIGAHLDWLRAVAPVAALFSDTESLWFAPSSPTPAAREDSLRGVPLPPPDRRWLWNIAPAPEEDPRFDLRHGVGAWLNLNARGMPPQTAMETPAS